MSALPASLRGRRAQCAALERLVDGARAGHSGALVLRGERGVGKTALLERAGELAAGCRVARAGGEAETDLAFAGLHRLCGQMLDRLAGLPAPQHDALAAAFGIRTGTPPNRLLVGLAVLGLLSDFAAHEPLICLIDDADALDLESAQALAFAARRLGSTPVAMVFAAREVRPALAGLPELVVEGLCGADARALLASVVNGPVDEPVRERLLDETRGNPLALLGPPHGLTPAGLAGGFGLPDALPLSERREQRFLSGLEHLPAGTRRLLLVAAAEPVGEPPLLWRAAGRLGLGTGDAAPAEAERVISIGAHVRFCHPLARTAIYRAAAPEERRAVHGALADVTDPEIDPDRRAWHRAQAAVGPDEQIAEELERSAGRAQERGGVAAAAAFLERAVTLTPDPARRSERALAGAQAKFTAGAPDAALGLLAVADAGLHDDHRRARIERLRAQISFTVTRAEDAPGQLLRAAGQLASREPGLARRSYLEALAMASLGGGLREVAAAARMAPAAPCPPRAADLLLDGLAVRFTDGYAAAAPTLKRALSAARHEDARDDGDILRTWMMCRAAMGLWDDETLDVLAVREIEFARATGAGTELLTALCFSAIARMLAGEFAAAGAALEEARAVTPAGGPSPLPHASMLLIAWQGDQARAADGIARCIADATDRGDGGAITAAELAAAVLSNGLGHHEAALAAARRAQVGDEGALTCFVAPELIEAAVRCGRPDVAAVALEGLRERTRASGSDWALGVEACCQALLSDGDEADALYREAIERLGRTSVAVHLARAHLLYGEWLRHEGRAAEARHQLRIARERFASMGAHGFAARAATAVSATGESRPRRTTGAVEPLTAQQAQIARLAGEGKSNQQIGAILFLSPRTVEYHLHKVFGKLHISSRTELGAALPADADALPVAA